jgi:ribosomal protein S27AE
MTLKDKHKCLENTLDRDCPICLGYLFTSTQPVIFLGCGHPVHSECLIKYQRTSIACPECRKTFLSKSDQEMVRQEFILLKNAQPMPLEYVFPVRIFCNDCGKTTITDNHFLGWVCGECGFINTNCLGRVNEEEQQNNTSSSSSSSTSQ